eukprot:TRINITY_DN4208_c0_g2_i1.p1 TRINITY_DN4208_c0_g2~~TRINITY_DN4208_c0_g2_i1.p1  ORF type:complete len:791 (+),score=132.63 TRINITY_DN4208_c0_g2_i1:32-2374(+)
MSSSQISSSSSPSSSSSSVLPPLSASTSAGSYYAPAPVSSPLPSSHNAEDLFNNMNLSLSSGSYISSTSTSNSNSSTPHETSNHQLHHHSIKDKDDKKDEADDNDDSNEGVDGESSSVTLTIKQRLDLLLKQKEDRKILRSQSENDLFAMALQEEESRSSGYQGAEPPANESQRLTALRKMNILDAHPDLNFDRLTRLGISLFKVKICRVSMVDDHRQWFMSAYGLPVRETCRNDAFCAFAIRHPEQPFIVCDTHLDDRFKNNPLVVGGPLIRFYAGMPLVSSDGYALGTYCVIDDTPHMDFGASEISLLRDMADVVLREMELFKQAKMAKRDHDRQSILSSITMNTLQSSSLKDLFNMHMVGIAEALSADYMHILEFTSDPRRSLTHCALGWQEGELVDMSPVADYLREIYNRRLHKTPHGHNAIIMMDDIDSPDGDEDDVDKHDEDDEMCMITVRDYVQVPTSHREHSPTDITAAAVAVPAVTVIPTTIITNRIIRMPGLLRRAGVRRGMCVLLAYEDKPYGLMGVYHEVPNVWSDEDVTFMLTCAASMSVLAERMQHSIQLTHERQRADELLYQVLPLSIGERLKANEFPIADSHANVTVLFADIVNFTELSTKVTPSELVNMLNDVFCSYDAEAMGSGLEKIKTIGDCYMVAAGMTSHLEDHADVIVEFAEEMLRSLDSIKSGLPEVFQKLAVRIGVHTGPIIAGVIGLNKFQYDVWGDTVNTASRLESSGASGRVHITQTTLKAMLTVEEYDVEPRGLVQLKGKGMMETYFIKKK